VSLVRQDEFKTILKQAVSEVKRIQLGYPSDYRSKSIVHANDHPPTITQMQPIALIGGGVVTISTQGAT